MPPCPFQDAQTQQRKFRQARISRDFQTAILSYQNAAKLSAEKQRRYVDQAKAALDQGGDSQAREGLSPGSDSRSQQQQQLQSVQTELVPDSELEYQEQLIQEREGEIEDIERGVLELNEIFRVLGTIVTEQQSMLGRRLSTSCLLPSDHFEHRQYRIKCHLGSE
jgi:syntaxin 7